MFLAAHGFGDAAHIIPPARLLEEFAAACQRALTADPGPAGREKVCAIVQDVLKDEAFVARHVGDDVPERKILYEHPSLGFCILAHAYHGAKESNPHDHGPSWEIYGQAHGETVMSDWALLQPATEEKPGKNPFTGEPMTVAAKPARNVVRAVPMKALKDMV